MLTEMKLVDRCPEVFESVHNHEMEHEPKERPYLHENKRDLDVYLHGDHSEEVYRSVCDNRANQSRKLERALIAVRVPNDDEERGYF